MSWPSDTTFADDDAVPGGGVSDLRTVIARKKGAVVTKGGVASRLGPRNLRVKVAVGTAAAASAAAAATAAGTLTTTTTGTVGK